VLVVVALTVCACATARSATVSDGPSAPVAAAAASPSPIATVTPRLASPTADPTTAPIRFVALGDSLTEGYGNDGPSWPVELAQAAPEFQLAYNAGVSGDTTYDMMDRFDRDVLAYQPDLLFIFGGANDLDECIDPWTVASNVETIVDRAQAAGIERVILILNEVPSVGYADTWTCGDDLFAAVDALNDTLIAFAGTRGGVDVVDLRVAFADYEDVDFVDGVHFSPLGVEIVVAAILPVLTQELTAASSR
jgi:lysophospholipase L1-like esterase